VSRNVLRITNGVKVDKVRGSCWIANKGDVTDVYRITDVEIVRFNYYRGISQYILSPADI
jgi:hypothetical protein